jgi:hypothetical protein
VISVEEEMSARDIPTGLSSIALQMAVLAEGAGSADQLPGTSLSNLRRFVHVTGR